jgi:hypothetical protein
VVNNQIVCSRVSRHHIRSIYSSYKEQHNYGEMSHLVKNDRDRNYGTEQLASDVPGKMDSSTRNVLGDQDDVRVVISVSYCQ